MKELKLIRDKISVRINSMANDDKGVYAKRMMQRCIKDIDMIVGAEQLKQDSGKDRSDAVKSFRATVDRDYISAMLHKNQLGIEKDENRMAKLNLLKRLVDDGLIHDDVLMMYIVDGII